MFLNVCFVQVRALGADQVIDYRSQKFETMLCSSDTEKLFDAIFDCTGEALKCGKLLREGGGICSILAAPDVEAIRDWIRNSEVEATQKVTPWRFSVINDFLILFLWVFSKVTWGVQGFLNSKLGGKLLNWATGASSLRTKIKEVHGRYNHVIGTGNGEIGKVDLLISEKIV